MTGLRTQVLVTAIRASLTGDVLLCEQVFSRDVAYTSPVLTTSSRDELETLLSSRRDALADVELSTDRLFEAGGSVFAEWRAAADHVRPFLIPADTRLDAPRKRISLSGASVAEFEGSRICAIRHYFDEAGLLEQLVAD